ncbi:hypothetical protein EU527_06925 [Candidatus Thorarchaeota archaeon]|nr:MAG: hypothetical protein EU527_06925 [Candidatus Thorarchaeota archaeon]
MSPLKFKLYFVGLIVLIFAFSVVVVTHTTILSRTDTIEEEFIPEEVIIDGTPVFTPSVAGDHYVNTCVSVSHGTVSDLIPGMGDSTSSTTSLTEEEYYIWSNLLIQTDFPSKPDGWTDSNIYYDGDFHDNGLFGYLVCSDVDTSSYDQVRFVLSIGVTIGGSDFGVSISFYNNTGNWNTVVYDVPQRAKSDYTVTSTESQYQHSAFKVRVAYGYLAVSGGMMWADNWRVQGHEYTGQRFGAVFQFTNVDYGTYANELLYVDFGSGSSEYLNFWFEGTLVVQDVFSDFNWDISDYLTDSTFQVEIRDANRDPSELDGLANWNIEKMYIKLTNTAPQNEGSPTCANLDDAENLYGMKKYYQITTYHSDLDGRDNIEEVHLQCFSNDHETMYWSLLYDGMFSESYDPNDYVSITSGTTGGTGTELEATFSVLIHWHHPVISDIDLRCIVYDKDGENDDDFYEVDWNIETRLDLSNHSLNDYSGTPDRGDINGSILASGEVVYYGSTLHPQDTTVDIYVLCETVSSSPWEAINYHGDTGQFSVNVQTNEEVGSDVYSFKVVSEGASSSSTSLLISAKMLNYTTDKIICTSLTSPQNIVDSTETGYMNVNLRYAFDNSAVIDGTFQLGNSWLIHQGGGDWQANYTPNMLTSIIYDSISIGTDNAHGITLVDMGENSITMYWEKLNCYIDGPISNVITIGENATGIHVWAEYYYWESHGFRYYNGTLNLNSSIFQYDAIGTRGYIVSSADGNDIFGIMTILFSQTTSCTWVYPDPPPTWNVDPTDQFAEYGQSFSYSLEVDAPWGVDTWWLSDLVNFSISADGTVTNATILQIGRYRLQVMVNDTYNRELTTMFVVIVQDTTPPIFMISPENQLIEYGDLFQYSLEVYDISGIDSWWVDDSFNFLFSSEGVVAAKRILSVGIYALHIMVNDTYGNEQHAYFDLTVQDTTSPAWDDEPGIIHAFSDELFILQLNVSDQSGISQWLLNDTARFSIDTHGIMRSRSNLEPGMYYIEVTVIDPYGNSSKRIIMISIESRTDGSVIVLLIVITASIGIGGVVLGGSIRTMRLIQRERMKQLQESKNEVDKALEYLDSIKPTKEDSSNGES